MQFTMYCVYEESKDKNKTRFLFGNTSIPLCFIKFFQTFGEAYNYIAEQANGNTMTEYVTLQNQVHYRFCERTNYKYPNIFGYYNTRQFTIVPRLITLHKDKPIVTDYIPNLSWEKEKRYSNVR